MTDKLTRSEAMDKLREAERELDSDDVIHGSWHYTALREAARDLLNAEDDLPYRVRAYGQLISAWTSEANAENYICSLPAIPNKYTITGPDAQTVDHGEDEQAESKTDPDVLEVARRVRAFIESIGHWVIPAETQLCELLAGKEIPHTSPSDHIGEANETMDGLSHEELTAIPAPEFCIHDCKFSDQFKDQLAGIFGSCCECEGGDIIVTIGPATSCPHMIPHLVPVETNRPTLDMMPDNEHHKAYYRHGGPWGYQVVVYHDGMGDVLAPAGTPAGDPCRFSGKPSDYIVLDADPVGPKTAGELEPGMIAKFRDVMFIKVENGYVVELHTGCMIALADNELLTGPVYRIEITD